MVLNGTIVLLLHRNKAFMFTAKAFMFTAKEAVVTHCGGKEC